MSSARPSQDEGDRLAPLPTRRLSTLEAFPQSRGTIRGVGKLELYLFHQAGGLEVQTEAGEKHVRALDDRGNSTYLRDILEMGV